MRISGIGAQPMIFNTNTVTSQSLDKIQGISDDVTSQKIDYSALNEEDNTNPLRKGTSANFMDILASQLAMSAQNASRVMKPEEAEEEAVASVMEDMQQEQMQNMQESSNMQQEENDVMAAGADDMFGQNHTNLFQMNRAIEAYTAFSA